MSVRWSEEETQRLIELWNSGAKVLDICYQIGRTERSVLHKVRDCRDKDLLQARNNFGFWTDELDAEIVRHRQAGLSGSKIAKLVGLTPRQVWNRFGRLNGTFGTIEKRYKAYSVCSFDNVRAVVLKEYQLSMSDILAVRKTKDVIEPRQVLMCVGYKYTRLSLPQIGQRLRRDHTTVLHAVKVAPVKYPQAVAQIEGKLLHREAAE